MSYQLKPWQRLLVLTKQISLAKMPSDLAGELVSMTIGHVDQDSWSRDDDRQADVLDLVERIEARTGVSSFFEGIIIDGPVPSPPSAVPPGAPGWSTTPPPPVIARCAT